jgi:hypothetical protein
MAAERRPGSDQGRAAIDWQEAFLFYAALPAELRDYRTVADKFGVSRRTVERHGRQDRWKLQARELDRDSVRLAAERLREERADKLVDTEKLIEATYVSYANQLVAGAVRITPHHVAKLFELREQIWDLRDTETANQVEQVSQPADLIDPTERKLQVLRALEDAGVLHRLLHPDRAQQGRLDGEHVNDGTQAESNRGEAEAQEREVA